MLAGLRYPPPVKYIEIEVIWCIFVIFDKDYVKQPLKIDACSVK